MKNTKRLGWLGAFRLFYHFILGVARPGGVKHVCKVGTILAESGLIEQTLEILRREPGGTEFLRKHDLQFDHPREYFAAFPAGTLGRVYYEFLTVNKVDPKDFPETNLKNDACYVEHLVRQSHDVWHVVTGFDISVAGELGLQAFMSRQMNWAFSMIAFAGGGLIMLFREPWNFPKAIEEIVRGFELGGKMKPLALVNWNEKWALPMEEVKESLMRRSMHPAAKRCVNE